MCELMLHRFGYKIEKISESKFIVSEETSLQVAGSVASIWNSAVNSLKSLCRGADWVLFLKVIIMHSNMYLLVTCYWSKNHFLWRGIKVSYCLAFCRYTCLDLCQEGEKNMLSACLAQFILELIYSKWQKFSQHGKEKDFWRLVKRQTSLFPGNSEERISEKAYFSKSSSWVKQALRTPSLNPIAVLWTPSIGCKINKF